MLRRMNISMAASQNASGAPPHFLRLAPERDLSAPTPNERLRQAWGQDTHPPLYQAPPGATQSGETQQHESTIPRMPLLQINKSLPSNFALSKYLY